MKFAYGDDYSLWEKWYVPPPSVPKDGLIVDVGARDGDSALFYAQHGYTNLRLVEPNPVYFADLEANLQEMTMTFPDLKVEVRQKRFELSDLDGAAFAKFDCEGCEYELVLESLKVPWAAEMHDKAPPDARGIYDYIHATGYRKSP